jgi:hypothetical protein
MRKLSIFLLLIASAMVLSYCSSSKKAAAAAPKTTYTESIQPIMAANCTPCHFPEKGKAKQYNTYAAVKGDIDNIITRISKNPGEKGFMPMKHPKLPDSTIQAFIKWKADGMPETR